MQITHNISLNLAASCIQPRIRMVQGDSNTRVIKAELWGGASPYIVPDGASVMVRFCKPDGTGGLYDETEGGAKVSFTGRTVTAPVATQMLAVAGTVRAEIDIFDASAEGSEKAAERLSSFSFLVEVTPSVYPDDTIISSDYYNVLSADIAKVLSAAVHSPKIGENGNWYTWDQETCDYTDTGVSARADVTPIATAEIPGKVKPGSDLSVAEDGTLNLADGVIPTEETVSGWGFTKNSGTYSKPGGGIPKTDLASAVQASLGKADSAVQPSQAVTMTATLEDGSTKTYTLYGYEVTSDES